MDGSSRPHVMVFPLPVQGHITPMMHLSLKLAARGIMVTFVTTQYRLAQILIAGEGAACMLTENEGIRLAGLEDGLPEDNQRNPTSMDFINSVDNLGAELEKLLGDLSCDDRVPPLTCLVSDSFLPWTHDLADKWSLPRTLFWTQSLAVCSSYMSLSDILAAGYDPFLNRVKRRGERPLIRGIPGLPPMDAYDLPFNADMDFPDEESENTKWLRAILEAQFHRVKECAWVMANTFQELEGPFAQALCSTSMLPASKLLLMGSVCTVQELSSTQEIFRASMWREEEDNCLHWLDTQQDASVLYISFGSVVVRTLEAMQEMAMALLACRQPFLWALRLGWEEARGSLSEEFWKFAMEAGKVTTWTPQLKVLSHRAVGGFLSHGGWNSTIESVSKGVPMLVWPCFLDQFTNSWAVSCHWGIGVQVMKEEGSDGVQELEKAIKALMQGQQSLVFRRTVAQLRDACAADSGQHFDLFVEDMNTRAKRTSPLTHVY
eukprot:c16128_g1_i1 orf=452-1921(+)